ncbi:hypothetical protein PROFUN_10479 [Planoprotostelium fungivorum]|uniref:Inositol-pentakisphosphate 2-kinase n=1 Tax=Planoprotostelium fungivorum TaxID=1890364 RepID=A0A2P6NDI2_9EUKA|nr:hypothetical protein PROFUN_10479 [Planoprotostelium fungivorum]
MDLCVEDWQYLNEGGENKGHALRLKKKTKKSHERDVEGAVRFQMEWRVLQISSATLTQLDVNIFQNRPQHRRKDPLDSSAIALLMPDLTYCPPEITSRGEENNPVFAVEIKPKWGDLPVSHYHTKEETPRACKYCMQQHMKFHHGEIEAISGYCPLDLFSQEPDRIRAAISSLIAQPQNNLKIFCGRDLLLAGALGGGDSTVSGEGMKLLDRYFTVDEGEGKLHHLKELIVQLLYHSDILQNLKRVQNLDRIGPAAAETIHNLLQERREGVDSDDLAEKEQKLRDFMVAATAKDCSIMLTIFPIRAGGEEVPSPFKTLRLDGSPHAFVCRTSIVDFDPKSSENLANWRRQETDIIRFFIDSGSNKRCG